MPGSQDVIDQPDLAREEIAPKVGGGDAGGHGREEEDRAEDGPPLIGWLSRMASLAR